MALKVKDAATAATKFVTRSQAAAQDYQKGVTGAGNTWQAHSAAAADSWGAGVQTAVSNGRYAKGVTRVGGQKWEAAATGKGAQRYPNGVSLAGPAWQAATGPYLDTIASLNLPPRRPKGDPANMQRAQMVADALRKKKVGG
jgi:hypothetical protein